MIDTGGIDVSKETFNEEIKIQAEIAINEADVVLFIVDGKEGITHNDLVVRDILRKSKKRVVVAINKVDVKEAQNHMYDFYELGFSSYIPISSIHNTGYVELMDTITMDFPDYNNEEEDTRLKFSIIGRPNVGKSSLTNALLNEDRVVVSNISGTTRDSIDSIFKYHGEEYVLIDTAGIRRKSKIKESIEKFSIMRTLLAIERADVCILMIDATEGVTEQDEKIIGYAHELGKAIMVIVNKWDLIEKDDKTMDIYKKDLASSLKFLSYAKYLFISAKTGQRTHKVLEVAKECYDNYNKRIGTGILNDVVSKAILMKEPPVVALKRLKVYYATQVATKPPKFVFFVNDVNARHFSYERYLENRLRDSFDFSGTGIQIEYRERKDK